MSHSREDQHDPRVRPQYRTRPGELGRCARPPRVIANAIDEQALTGSRDPEIFADGRGCWHIRDWGRGVRYEHLTQNENQEKLANPGKVVGKFGVGLKDALATFDRHDITVTIRTRHGDITTSKQAKHGFADIQTLHALISEPSDPGLSGTEFILCGDALGEQEIQEAKALFLRYSGDQELGSTAFGSVLKPQEETTRARIYVNGLRVAEEDNFLFSYNITSPTAALRRALNRERSNVGRSAYTSRVKDILLACDADHVIDALIADLQNYERGSQHDETQWLDVGLHACRQLNARRQVIFLTASELTLAPDFVRRARDDGYQIIVVPESIRAKLRGLRDPLGNPMRDLERYRDEWQDSFEFTFINPENMTVAEQRIWETLPAVLATRGGRPAHVKGILISETMRLMEGRYQEAAGLWDPAEGHIIVKRTQLRSLAAFAGTVLHEVTRPSAAHPTSASNSSRHSPASSAISLPVKSKALNADKTTLSDALGRTTWTLLLNQTLQIPALRHARLHALKLICKRITRRSRGHIWSRTAAGRAEAPATVRDATSRR